MMQDASGENAKDTSEVKTVEINEGSLTPLQAVEKSQVTTLSNFGPDMSGSDDDEASEVSSDWMIVFMRCSIRSLYECLWMIDVGRFFFPLPFLPLHT